MRLDSHSVERLYASAASRCRPRRLEALILHTRAGTPAAEPICAGGDGAEGDAEEGSGGSGVVVAPPSLFAVTLCIVN